MSHIWSFESANRVLATSNLVKVPTGYEPHLVFDMGTIPRIKIKHFKGNLIDNTFKGNFIDNIPRIGRKRFKGNFINSTSKERFY